MFTKSLRFAVGVALAVMLSYAWGQAVTPPAESAPAATEPAVGSPAGMAKGAHAPQRHLIPPVLIRSEAPDYTDEARRQRISGVVQLSLTVDEKGLPQNVQVSRGKGKALDDEAVKAVRQYKFKPALQDGKPVPVTIFVYVDFE
ncbi:MAG: energy transducer TonB [Janthinobacterium lividum]